MTTPQQQHHSLHHDDDDDTSPRPHPLWWQRLWRTPPKQNPPKEATGREEPPRHPAPAGASHRHGRGHRDGSAGRRSRSCPPPSSSTAASSYPTRQFPPLFLLLLTALLALCLVALWRQANEDLECLVAPGFASSEGMRRWLARAYDVWRERGRRGGGGRAGTRMCYSVVSEGGGVVAFVFFPSFLPS